MNEGNELRIKPGRGDLVIHGSHDDYAHGVDPVLSGTRFAFSNFVLPTTANPGTFYSYKSDEYNEQIIEAKKIITCINGSHQSMDLSGKSQKRLLKTKRTA